MFRKKFGFDNQMGPKPNEYPKADQMAEEGTSRKLNRIP